ncbi:ABC transporter ATP-binding protein [Bacillus sp. N1-1]|jgi:energy-coupling factor transport system ATP-binding protein|uniref:ABC transporter ATP-binding protein n=1 Tax=Bacillus sp. N1-1 TaxID=2682541 RepID=UPI001318F946|nr:ABC transporter ATP-binding protein [Bacillus sp. N1-1]QHA91530.1 ATP-binding cassette domain-containing protein [Bacillus sp. N1-1]
MKVGVSNLRVKYAGAKTLLFNNLSLQVKEGEKVLFLGPSGCGKSTLLQILSGLIPNAVPVPMKADQVKIPESSGFVFQDPDSQFCMPYVDEEMAFVLENRAVPQPDMEGFIHHYLNKVGLHFGDPHVEISSLSQGMKQRLAIASMLALEPDVIFLDEPTALLDPEGTTEVWNTIKQINAKQTMIIVEHKIDEVIHFVDRIVLFDSEGKMIADADPKSVFSFYKPKLKEYGIWYPGVWDEHKKDKNLPAPYIKGQQLMAIHQLKGYRGKTPKIEVSDATAHEGEWIVVTGKNGAGKSSFLLSLMNVMKTTGTKSVRGQPLKTIKASREQLAFVFQNPEFQFVTNSVYDELAYSLEMMDDRNVAEKVKNWLEAYELHHVQNLHPYQLSTGQKRRLSVGTALFGDQPVLLLDEPTFGQDASNTFKLLALFEQLRSKGMLIMMVTHDEMIVQNYATREWVIQEGKLIEDRELERSEEGGRHAVDSTI